MDVQQNSPIFSYGNYPDQLYYGRSVYYFGSGPYTIPFRFTVPRRNAVRLFRHRSMENHRAASYHQPPPPLSSAVLSFSRFNARLWFWCGPPELHRRSLSAAYPPGVACSRHSVFPPSAPWPLEQRSLGRLILPPLPHRTAKHKWPCPWPESNRPCALALALPSKLQGRMTLFGSCCRFVGFSYVLALPFRAGRDGWTRTGE